MNKEKNSQKCIIAENISISVTFLTGRGSLTSETSFIAIFLLTKGELFLNRFLLFFVRIDVTFGPLNKCLNLHHWTRVRDRPKFMGYPCRVLGIFTVQKKYPPPYFTGQKKYPPPLFQPEKKALPPHFRLQKKYKPPFFNLEKKVQPPFSTCQKCRCPPILTTKKSPGPPLFMK